MFIYASNLKINLVYKQIILVIVDQTSVQVFTIYENTIPTTCNFLGMQLLIASRASCFKLSTP